MKTLFTTFPKSGTHLLRQIIGPHAWLPPVKDSGAFVLLKRCGVVPPPFRKRPGGRSVQDIAAILAKVPYPAAVGHLPYNEDLATAIRDCPAKVVLLVRDPRDVVVSHYWSYMRHEKRQAGFDFWFEDGLRLSQKDDPLLWGIRLAPDWWAGWTPWIEKHAVDLVIRFEDLVGPDRDKGIAPLVPFLGEGFSVTDSIARIDPSKSLTFRKGDVGAWKYEFRQRHIDLFDQIMGPTMRLLRYD